MAKGVLIVGGSGSGKSTSVRNLDPQETFVINVQGKPLPIDDSGYINCEEGEPPKEGNLYYTDKPKTILSVLKYISDHRSEIKNIVVDDIQYASVNEFMSRINEKGYNKFNDIGYGIWSLPQTLPKLREDLIVFFISHDEVIQDETENKYRRAKTMGKLVEQQVGGIEGFFTYVLFTEVSKGDKGIKYNFLTNSEGDTTAKTPMGMFDNLRIENDLLIIKNKLNV